MRTILYSPLLRLAYRVPVGSAHPLRLGLNTLVPVELHSLFFLIRSSLQKFAVTRSFCRSLTRPSSLCCADNKPFGEVRADMSRVEQIWTNVRYELDYRLVNLDVGRGKTRPWSCDFSNVCEALWCGILVYQTKGHQT